MLEFSRLYNPAKKLADSKRVVEKTSLNTAGDLPEVPIETDVATVEYNRDQSRLLRVRFQGVSWRAKCLYNFPCEPGTLVKVAFRQGNTLIIEALTQS